MKAKLRENSLWIGKTFIFLGILLWIVGWDRVTFPAVGEMNADLMFMSLGAVLTVFGRRQKMKQ